LSEELGDPVETAAQYPAEIRNEIGERLFNMVAQEIFILNSFHCDPHPGNFAFRADGSVVVYDFGGIKELDQPVVQTYKTLMNAAIQSNVPVLEDALRDLKVRNHHGQIPADFYIDWRNILLPPMIEPFDFSSSKVHLQTVSQLRKSMKYWDSFMPSAETMMVNRTISGHYWNMIHLKVNYDFKALTEQYITA